MRLRATEGVILCTAAVLIGVASPATAQDPIISPDSVMSVILPKGFQPYQMNPVAELQFADTLSGTFFLAVIEEKEDLFGWNLTRHSMITLAQMMVALDFPEMSDAVHIEVSGDPAVQYEVRGVVQGTRIAYLHTTVDAPTAFVQLLGWTVQSKWDLNQAMLREIVESVEIVDPEPTDPRPSESIWDIIPGTWAWEHNEPVCESKTQTFEISEDGTAMTITHSEPFEREDGSMESVTNYVVEGATATALNTFIPEETRLTEDGVPVKWDLVMVARNRLVWHRTDWPEGSLTAALRRCSAGG